MKRSRCRCERLGLTRRRGRGGSQWWRGRRLSLGCGFICCGFIDRHGVSRAEFEHQLADPARDGSINPQKRCADDEFVGSLIDANDHDVGVDPVPGRKCPRHSRELSERIRGRRAQRDAAGRDVERAARGLVVADISDRLAVEGSALMATAFRHLALIEVEPGFRVIVPASPPRNARRAREPIIATPARHIVKISRYTLRGSAVGEAPGRAPTSRRRAGDTLVFDVRRPRSVRLLGASPRRQLSIERMAISG